MSNRARILRRMVAFSAIVVSLSALVSALSPPQLVECGTSGDAPLSGTSTGGAATCKAAIAQAFFNATALRCGACALYSSCENEDVTFHLAETTYADCADCVGPSPLTAKCATVHFSPGDSYTLPCKRCP
jgi:hypothetical protein